MSCRSPVAPLKVNICTSFVPHPINPNIQGNYYYSQMNVFILHMENSKGAILFYQERGPSACGGRGFLGWSEGAQIFVKGPKGGANFLGVQGGQQGGQIFPHM